MREFKKETIVITKEGWKHLQIHDRTSRGFSAPKDEWLERCWSRAYRNGGANPETHPIADNEIRVEDGTCLMRIDKIKSVLENGGFEYRQDGFIAEGFDL